MRGKGRTVQYECAFCLCTMNYQERLAAKATGGRFTNGKSKRRRHSTVDSITALSQHSNSGLGSMVMLC